MRERKITQLFGLILGALFHLHPDPERLRFLSVQSRDVITASGAQITAGDRAD
jgi:hypothetical protein